MIHPKNISFAISTKLPASDNNLSTNKYKIRMTKTTQRAMTYRRRVWTAARAPAPRACSCARCGPSTRGTPSGGGGTRGGKPAPNSSYLLC